MTIDTTDNDPTPQRIAIYPGSFDPMTNGHVDIIKRGLRLFDKVIVAVGQNASKQAFFTAKERATMITDVLCEIVDIARIEVICFSGLLITCAKDNNASVILRGLRTTTDFEYEFQMAMMNNHLGHNDVETLFFMTGESVFFVHSNTIKDVLRLGGDTKGLIPKLVYKRFKERLLELERAQK